MGKWIAKIHTHPLSTLLSISWYASDETLSGDEIEYRDKWFHAFPNGINAKWIQFRLNFELWLLFTSSILIAITFSHTHISFLSTQKSMALCKTNDLGS